MTTHNWPNNITYRLPKISENWPAIAKETLLATAHPDGIHEIFKAFPSRSHAIGTRIATPQENEKLER
jgi:hypothetical protein